MTAEWSQQTPHGGSCPLQDPSLFLCTNPCVSHQDILLVGSTWLQGWDFTKILCPGSVGREKSFPKAYGKGRIETDGSAF